MITSIKETRKINSFVKVAIPSPKDLFRRYGERDSHGVYSSDCSEGCPNLQPSSSVIGQMINAQKLMELELSNRSQ